ncbi:hypothetical protein HHX47_DHR1001594 [Lentinula edodes]|nr:hypothetical protein HHX47_DHR1001594 [Lentinula edodes]
MTMPGDMGALGAGGKYLVGQDSDYPSVNFDAWNLNAPVNTHVNVQADHKDLILEIDRASTVLLKNTAGVLPLKKPSTLAIVGNGAFNSSKGPNGYSDRSGDDGVLAMGQRIGWGSGTDNFPYLIAPIDAITSRASTQGTVVSSSSSDTDLNGAAAAAINKDVALVFITVTAVVWSGLPGQEAGTYCEHSYFEKLILMHVAGNGVTDILYGDYNPSGRLPFTIAKATTDYSAQVIYQDVPDSNILPIPYNEGIFIDYRHFDAADIAPRFEFGFGLSYTSFAYSGISVSGSTSSSSSAPSGPGAILNPW